MSNYFLLIYPALLLIVIFYKCKIAENGLFNIDMWSAQQTNLIRAGACIGVILHHLTQEITYYGEISKGPITILSQMGILFTSVFFFSSGYGLITNVYEKENYLDGFLLHRLPAILVPFYFSNVITLLIKIYYNHFSMGRADIIKCLSGYHLLNGNGWFVVEIFFLYLFFYVIFRIVKNKDVATILLCLATCFIIYMGYRNGHDYTTIGDRWFYGEWWYNSTTVFAMGIIFARFKERIIAFAEKFYYSIVCGVTLLFIMMFVVEEYVRNVYGYYREGTSIDAINSKAVTFTAQTVLCILFMFVVLLINMKISIGNKVLYKLSLISTELFLVHGLFVKDIFDSAMFSEWLYFLVVIISSIPIAILLYLIDKPVIKLLRGVRREKAYLKDCEIDLVREKRERKLRVLKIIIPALIVAICAVIGGIKLYRTQIGDRRQYDKEIAAIKNAKIGDIVSFGNTESDFSIPGKESINWIVLKQYNDEDGNKVMLISEKGLSGSVYHKKHAEIAWDECDLHSFLNEELLQQLFNEYELEAVIENPNCGDKLSLLSADEAVELFADDFVRQIDITEAALADGTNLNVRSKANNWDMKGYRSSWWWLRGTESGITAPIVTVDGTIVTDEKYVNKPNGAVRPVVWVEY